jgi:hypothetical protein
VLNDRTTAEARVTAESRPTDHREGVLFVYSGLGFWTGDGWAGDFRLARHYPDGAASLRAAGELTDRLGVACSSGYCRSA